MLFSAFEAAAAADTDEAADDAGGRGEGTRGRDGGGAAMLLLEPGRDGLTRGGGAALQSLTTGSLGTQRKRDKVVYWSNLQVIIK